MAAEMHNYYDRHYTPKVKTGRKCSSCWLKELCIPKLEKAETVKALYEIHWDKNEETSKYTLYLQEKADTWR